MNTKLSTPSKEVRLTIPVSAEVHEIFSRVAKAGSIPIGRAMGEWLADTAQAAEFMAEKMEQARMAPSLVARELHSYALGLTDQTQALIQSAKGGGAAADSGLSAAGAVLPPFGITKRPPSCNTGGKVSGDSKKRPGGELS